MPKLHSPFVREMKGKRYLVKPEITEGYEWVFRDDSVMAIEKLDGTNVSVVIEGGEITQIYNRMERVPFFNKSRRFIIDAVLNSYEKGYTMLTDGQYFGEVVGPKVGSAHSGGANPYGLSDHVWIPFDTYGKEKLRYTSWGKYPKTFDAISSWFENDIFSLFARRREIKRFPEGVIFTHPDGRMAKLRRDMFPWYNKVVI